MLRSNLVFALPVGVSDCWEPRWICLGREREDHGSVDNASARTFSRPLISDEENIMSNLAAINVRNHIRCINELSFTAPEFSKATTAELSE